MLSKANFPKRAVLATGACLWLAGIWLAGYVATQKDFSFIILTVSVAFGGYALLVYVSPASGWSFALGLLARIILIPAFPMLSDDIYRFYWDGQLALAGISPYSILPEDALRSGVSGVDYTLFSKLNSPSYYTVYPPVAQLYYVIAAGAGSIYGFAIWMKAAIVLTEGLAFGLLIRLAGNNRATTQYGVLYFLNPLVILEGSGNLHFEVVMVAFMALALHYYFDGSQKKSAAYLSVGIGTKLLPVMLMPWFLFSLKGRQRAMFFLVMAIITTAIFWPVWSHGGISGMLHSTDLYFRKFEFNASVYFLLREAGLRLTGYNLIAWIGPILASAVLLTNLRAAASAQGRDRQDFFKYALLSWTVYLMLATTVHPWYVIPLVFLASGTSCRFPVLWSFTAFFSYVHYDPLWASYELWWLLLEYVSVTGLMAYELRKGGQTIHPG